MEKIRIRGGVPLKGSIRISGSKNAALPLMAASLLTSDTLVLSNIPDLADISMLTRLLAELGVTVAVDGDASEGGRVLSLTADEVTSAMAPYELVRKMRASVLVLGPLLARNRRARVSLPGGCAIGLRPVDYHIRALAALGAEISLEDGYIHAVAPNGLKGTEVRFPDITVGGTENTLMAACLADGETVIVNAAREPEIADLAHCLVSMGAQIQGIGTGTLKVVGVERLHGAAYTVLPDRIEAGSYAVAAAITDGEIELLGARADLMESVVGKLEQAGVAVAANGAEITVRRGNRGVVAVDVTTRPYPGFPTDMQAQMMALMCIADGSSTITETIFENRFTHVSELTRMGAEITLQGSSAVVHGVDRLRGAPVMATDLRASVSLILAGLAAEGETVVSRVYHLDRGYERLEEKLAACGAGIERIDR
jgi:UDP-N-acetylglucosamine 1-carboxyvinyltransferase